MRFTEGDLVYYTDNGDEGVVVEVYDDGSVKAWFEDGTEDIYDAGQLTRVEYDPLTPVGQWIP